MHDTSLLHMMVIMGVKAKLLTLCDYDNAIKLDLAWLKYTFYRTVPVCSFSGLMGGGEGQASTRGRHLTAANIRCLLSVFGHFNQ